MWQATVVDARTVHLSTVNPSSALRTFIPVSLAPLAKVPAVFKTLKRPPYLSTFLPTRSQPPSQFPTQSSALPLVAALLVQHRYQP